MLALFSALVGAGLIRDAAAEPIITPSGDQTPGSFAAGCLAVGPNAEVIEIEGPDGSIAESSCSIGGELASECDWTSGICTDFTREVPTPARSAPGDGVLQNPDEPTADPTTSPEPTADPTIPPEPTADSTTAADAAAPTTAADAAAPTTTADAAASTTDTDAAAPTTAADAASLTIVLSTCASGYDLFAPDADPAQDCPDTTDGIQFSIGANDANATRSTGEDGAGVAVFANLAPGAYRLVEQLPPDIAFAFVLDCTSNVRTFDGSPFVPLAMVGENGSLGVTVQATENLACAWYHVPAAEQATLSATLQWCTGKAVNPAACDLYADGFALTLSSADASGVATFGVPAGIYTLTEEGGRQWCFAESDAFDGDGSLVVQAGQTVAVTVYNCGDKP